MSNIQRASSLPLKSAAWLAAGAFALAGCFGPPDDPPLDPSHPFERAILGFALDDPAVVRRAAEELERLVGTERTMPAFERALLAQRAVCLRDNALHCTYRKRKRYTPFLYPRAVVYYELDFIIRRSRNGELDLTVCYGVAHAGASRVEPPEIIVPREKHCSQ